MYQSLKYRLISASLLAVSTLALSYCDYTAGFSVNGSGVSPNSAVDATDETEVTLPTDPANSTNPTNPVAPPQNSPVAGPVDSGPIANPSTNPSSNPTSNPPSNPPSTPPTVPTVPPINSKVTPSDPLPPVVVDNDHHSYCRDDNEEDSDDNSSDKKILICHVPPGNPSQAHNILISMKGWLNGHQPHHSLDKLGMCGSEPQAGSSKKNEYKSCDKENDDGEDAGESESAGKHDQHDK